MAKNLYIHSQVSIFRVNNHHINAQASIYWRHRFLVPNEDLPHRPMPSMPWLGLVSTVPPQKSSLSSSSSPPSSAPSTPSPSSSRKTPAQTPKPKLNWIYADERTGELKYGPRAEAKTHAVVHWDWTEDEQGLTFKDEECLVAVEEKRDTWAIYWDREDDRLKGHGIGNQKRVLRCSLERRLVEEKRVKGLDEDDWVSFEFSLHTSFNL